MAQQKTSVSGGGHTQQQHKTTNLAMRMPYNLYIGSISQLSLIPSCIQIILCNVLCMCSTIELACVFRVVMGCQVMPYSSLKREMTSPIDSLPGFYFIRSRKTSQPMDLQRLAMLSAFVSSTQTTSNHSVAGSAIVKHHNSKWFL